MHKMLWRGNFSSSGLFESREKGSIELRNILKGTKTEPVHDGIHFNCCSDVTLRVHLVLKSQGSSVSTETILSAGRPGFHTRQEQ